MSKNYELELYKIVNSKSEELVSELGWVSDTEFCVWISYYHLDDFIDKITDIFGYGIFDEGSFDANMQSDGVCIDLCKALEGYDVDFESIFPKGQYKH